MLPAPKPHYVGHSAKQEDCTTAEDGQPLGASWQTWQYVRNVREQISY